MENSDVLKRLVADPAAFLADPDERLRRLAAAACREQARDPEIGEALRRLLATDDIPEVRAAAASALAARGSEVLDDLVQAGADPAPVVAEAAVTALGEVGDARAVPTLADLANRHDDSLVREGAVAALGEIGAAEALPVLLDLVASGPPQVRRRCVAALSVFEGAEVEAAIQKAAQDRNPMVREAAEMVTGRPLERG